MVQVQWWHRLPIYQLMVQSDQALLVMIQRNAQILTHVTIYSQCTTMIISDQWKLHLWLLTSLRHQTVLIWKKPTEILFSKENTFTISFCQATLKVLATWTVWLSTSKITLVMPICTSQLPLNSQQQTTSNTKPANQTSSQQLNFKNKLTSLWIVQSTLESMLRPSQSTTYGSLLAIL